MGNRFVAFGLALVLFSMVRVHGDTDDVLDRSFITFGINEHYYHYSENLPTNFLHYGTPKSVEYGATSLFHIEGRWYPRQSQWYGGGLFEYGGGIHTYDGSTQGSDTIIRGDTMPVFYAISNPKSNTFTKVAFFGGPHFGSKNFMAEFHGGLLYYRWFRAGLGPMDETYSWLYFPMGVDLAFKANNTLSFGLEAEYRVMLSGKMKVGLDYYNLVGATASISNDLALGPEDGFLIQMPVRFQLNSNVGLEYKTWFEWRPSGVSSNQAIMTTPGLSGPIYEPESKSYSIGFTLSAMVRRVDRFQPGNGVQP